MSASFSQTIVQPNKSEKLVVCLRISEFEVRIFEDDGFLSKVRDHTLFFTSNNLVIMPFRGQDVMVKTLVELK